MISSRGSASPCFRFLVHVKSRRKPTTVQGHEIAIRVHLLPKLGSKRITDITGQDIERLHASMLDRPHQANRTIAVFSAMWSWAANKRKLVEASANPAKGVEKNPEGKRERYLTSAELTRLGDTLREAEAAGLPYAVDETSPKAKHAPKPDNRRRAVDPFAIAAIRMLIFTGARLREVLHAKWEWIDFERGMIRLPDSKTGAKTIYLSSAAIEVLGSIPRLADNPFVFPGEKAGSPRADLRKPWAAITEAAKLEGLRIHDLRHSFASVGAGASLGLPIIGKLLGHTQATTTHRYAHLDADPMRRAVETIGSTIAKAMDKPTKGI
jgi:integrase